MIRRANYDDVLQVAEIHVSSWRTTYQGVFSDHFLQSLSVENKVEQWRQNLAQADSFIYVAEAEGKIVGFINGGKSRSKKLPFEAEIYAMYLLKEYQNKGIGRNLFAKAQEEFVGRSWQSMVVWVLEGNTSKHFYEKMGGIVIADDHQRLEGNEHRLIAYGWDQFN
ncbi:GNAT family N-acetyltransferase [Pseudalkalibacillus sp. SCS-8]|uniref:GNAT family N-acetyltransferase n=1 Tax=Pseudalkalibacillus nanhaiensis TaxID=3115291 RepID=UPI0032DA69D6